ncbi:uncharacterized protein DUF4336 [Rhizobium sp. ERR 1071]|uniref:DUF4336 domain-containing protein n=1 Tax=Rhizobium sp. ERR 1071 TaxID=2572677 RepID=UPI00119B53E0|nr:DUF4336 domain-containing protein [Rhizobium sp. ERR1071]TWB07976.1 uncharacterized protein DUF4336 [Rhizobium sp. ERR1071]
MSFPTRTTVIRLAGGLFVHSPTTFSPTLERQLQKLGSPRWIVGPNRIHYWWIPDWKDAYPGSDIYLAPHIREQSKGRINFAAHALSGKSGYPWDDELATLPVEGSYMTEFEFFHSESRTLVLTDLIENFESSRLNGRLMRFLTWLGGVQDPHGSMPRDMKMTFLSGDLKAAVEQMIEWNPERIILAHGRWYKSDGARELHRAFAWLLR